MRLRTARLELVASTLETASWELSDPKHLAAWLAVPDPGSWPPPLNDEASQRWNFELLRGDPEAVGWGFWYVVRTEPDRALIGNGGFKGRPSNGSCEIGYSLLPEFQGRGYATEAAQAWIAWAFTHPDVTHVIAETLPQLITSIRVMEKCGMEFASDGKLEEGERTVRCALSRDDHLR